MGPVKEQNRKILSPLDKKSEEFKKEQPYYQTESNEEQNSESLVDHLTALRKQLIKSVVVFLLFFVLAFSTMTYWFPYVTKGNELVAFGPFQIVKF